VLLSEIYYIQNLVHVIVLGCVEIWHFYPIYSLGVYLFPGHSVYQRLSPITDGIGTTAYLSNEQVAKVLSPWPHRISFSSLSLWGNCDSNLTQRSLSLRSLRSKRDINPFSRFRTVQIRDRETNYHTAVLSVEIVRISCTRRSL